MTEPAELTPLLIAFDNPVESNNIRTALEASGYDCAQASSGEEVLSSFRNHRPPLMVVGCTFYDMHVEELVEELEKQTFLPPFIVVAHQADTSRAVELMKKGAADYLVKDENLAERLPAVVFRALSNEQVKKRVSELERSLRESENRFRTLSENTPDMLIRFDRGHRLLYLNPAAEAAYGLDSNKIAGQTLIAANLPEAMIHSWEEALTNTFKSEKGQTLQWQQEGQHGPNTYDLLFIPEFDVIGRVATVLLAGRDITKAKQLEEQLFNARKNESIGTLAGVVAHDLNNMLTPILGYATILKREFPADHPLAKGTGVIEKAAERAAGLISRLLVFSKQIKHLNLPVDLKMLVNDMVAEFRSRASERMQIITQCSPDVPPALGDPFQLKQVLQNLVSNAFDSMPEGGRLLVDLSLVILDADFCRHHPSVTPGPHACLTVADTGCGIPEGIRDRIFEPFFSTKGVEPGRGLGLSLVYSVVKSHSGTLSIKSTEGEGTTLKVFLPLVANKPSQ